MCSISPGTVDTAHCLYQDSLLECTCQNTWHFVLLFLVMTAIDWLIVLFYTHWPVYFRFVMNSKKKFIVIMVELLKSDFEEFT